MRRIFMFTLLALTMLGGVASADRSNRHRVRDHRGGVHVQNIPRHHHSSRYVAPRSTYRQSYRQTYRPTYRQDYRQTYRSNYRVVRRPIYVQRPVIQYRYRNYYQQPAIIVENYPPMTGYTWIPGHWHWNGYEWLWQPGHYQPDAAYDQYPQYQDAPSSYYNDPNGVGYSY